MGLFNPISDHMSARMLRWPFMLPLKNVDDPVLDIPEILHCGERGTKFLITSREIAKATGKDPILSKVFWYIQI